MICSFPFPASLYPASNFCFHCMNSQTGLPGEFVYQGGPDYTGCGSRVGSPNKNDFAPRFNFAWSPLREPQDGIRGGYDIFIVMPTGPQLHRVREGATSRGGTPHLPRTRVTIPLSARRTRASAKSILSLQRHTARPARRTTLVRSLPKPGLRCTPTGFSIWVPRQKTPWCKCGTSKSSASCPAT